MNDVIEKPNNIKYVFTGEFILVDKYNKWNMKIKAFIAADNYITACYKYLCLYTAYKC